MPTDMRARLQREYEKRKREEDFQKNLDLMRNPPAAKEVAKAGLGSAAMIGALPIAAAAPSIVNDPSRAQIKDVLGKLKPGQKLTDLVAENLKVPRDEAGKIADAIVTAFEKAQWDTTTDVGKAAKKFVAGHSMFPALKRVGKGAIAPAAFFGTVGALGKMLAIRKERKRMRGAAGDLSKSAAAVDPLEEAYWNELEKISESFGARLKQLFTGGAPKAMSRLESAAAGAPMRRVPIAQRAKKLHFGPMENVDRAVAQPKAYAGGGLGAGKIDMSPGFDTVDEQTRRMRGYR